MSQAARTAGKKMTSVDKLGQEPSSRQRRRALAPSQILNQLPNTARAKHLCGVLRESAYQLQNTSKGLQSAKPSTSRGHNRQNAMDWDAFTKAMACTTPTSLYPGKTGEQSLPPPPAPYFNCYVNQQLETSLEHDNPSPDINKFISQLSCTGKPNPRDEISSLEYSDTSSDDETDECVESAIFASVAVSLDFSSIEKALEDFQCAICLESGNLDSVATVSGCAHHFCFQCIVGWAAKKNRCPLCKKEFHLVASRRQVRWY